MIEKDTAKQQIRRLSGLDKFPTTSDAITELVLAIQVAEMDSIAIRFIDEWLHTETEAPKPSHMRIMLYDLNQAIKTKRKQCKLCDGSGVVTVWYLVTYRGNSYYRESAVEIENCAGYEQARDFAQLIADTPGNKNQTVLSAAKPCACRMAATA